MQQIKMKEEKAEKEIKRREQRKRKKDEDVLLKKTKKPKVLIYIKYNFKENIRSVIVSS